MRKIKMLNCQKEKKQIKYEGRKYSRKYQIYWCR